MISRIRNMQVISNHVSPKAQVFQPHQQKIRSLVNLPKFYPFHRTKNGNDHFCSKGVCAELPLATGQLGGLNY